MKRLVFLLILSGAIVAPLAVHFFQNEGDKMKVGLQVVGSVEDILAGRGQNGVGIRQLGLRYGLGAIDDVHGMGNMGEGFIFDGQIWVRPSNNGTNLPSMLLKDSAFSSFLAGFDAHHEVTGHKSVSQQINFGSFLETLVMAQHTPSRIFGYYGIVDFLALESSVLIKPAIHGEPITSEHFRPSYFQFSKDEKPHRAQVFGLCLNPKIGNPSELESRIFYKNPAAKSTSVLESHSHALVNYDDGTVEVVHVLQQSLISFANVTIIAAN